jgi:multiple sugar transport system permease protein
MADSLTGVSGALSSRRRGSAWNNKIARWCWLFALPAIILSALFSFYPMVMSWWYSFLDWSGFTTKGQFIGLGNYRELIHDSTFWSAFGRSFVFMLVGTPIQIGVALLLAIVLNNQVLKLSPLFRTMIFLPVVTSAAIVGIVMTFVLGSFQGPVNQALLDLHLVGSPIKFLSNPHTALWSVLGIYVWKNIGITMIYWLAALQTVPNQLYEAAKIDGATGRQTVRHITVPLLLPFAILIVILTAKGALHTFAIVQATTGGGPYFSTEVIETYIYQTAFAATDSGGVPRLGYASAAGCFFGIATLLIALIQAWAARKVNNMRGQLKTEAGA